MQHIVMTLYKDHLKTKYIGMLHTIMTLYKDHLKTKYIGMLHTVAPFVSVGKQYAISYNYLIRGLNI